MVTQILGGDAPLFFFVDGGDCRVITPGLLTDKMQDVLPLPQNIHRHFMRTQLRNLGVEPDLVDAWMGHAQFGHEAFESYSVLALNDLRRLAEVINEYLRIQLQVTPIPAGRNFANKVPMRTVISGFPEGRPAKVRLRRREQAIDAAVDTLIRRHLSGINLKIPNTSNYESGKNTILLQIEKRFSKMNEYRKARNYFATFINEGNREGRWSLPVPEYIVKVKRPKPLREKRWYGKVRHLARWRKRWLDYLELVSIGGRELALSDLLVSSLLSAILHGGLCIAEAVVALRKNLCSTRKPFIQHYSLIWMDLLFECSSQAINTGNENTLRRWFPDTVTLALMTQLLKRVKAGKRSDVEALNSTDTWTMIRRYATKVSEEKLAFASLGQLCKSAIGVTENLPGVRLPQALVEYCAGRLPSASLPEVHWLSLLQKSGYQPIEMYFSDFKAFPVVNKGRSRGNIVAKNIETLIKSIRNSLRTKNEAGKKRHSGQRR